jgi:hypothetical protein
VKDPAAQENKAHRGGDQIGNHQHREFDHAVWLSDKRVQPGQRTAGDRERDSEHDQALEVVAGRIGATADAERESPVGGGITNRGE